MRASRASHAPSNRALWSASLLVLALVLPLPSPAWASLAPPMSSHPDARDAGGLAGELTAAASEAEGWANLFPPGGHEGHTAIYDPVRQRMIVFGGREGVYRNDVWVMTLSGSPAWIRWSPAGAPPSARTAAAAIYDPVRDRMIVFGGYDGSRHNDVWALSLDGAPAWSQLAPAGTPPSARSGHAMIYDPMRDRLVLFAGYDGSYRGDVWALTLSGTPEWSELAPSGTAPHGRSTHTAIYDPVRDRMVMLGGTYFDGVPMSVKDIWALTLTGTPTWSEITPAGTPPVATPTLDAIYEPAGDRIVVLAASEDLEQVWEVPLSVAPAWSPLTSMAQSPLGGNGQRSVILDPVGGRMVIFGGSRWDMFGSPLGLRDAWALALLGTPTWTELCPASAPPEGRSGHTAIYDPVRDRMIVFGALQPSGMTDLLALTLSGPPVWSQVVPTGTLPSGGGSRPSALYDSARDRMIVFGCDFGNSVWALTLLGTPAWNLLTPTGTPPSSGTTHVGAYDTARERMVICGTDDVGDVLALTLSGEPEWSRLYPSGSSPDSRSGYTLNYDPVRDRLLLFGGDAYNDVWELTLSGTPAWSQLSPSGTPPSGRWGHTAVYDPVRDRLVVIGGYDGILRGDAWALSLAGGPAWTQLVPDGPMLEPRREHTAIFDPVRDRTILFGGYSISSLLRPYFLNDAWALWSPGILDVASASRHDGVSLAPPRPNPARGTVTFSFTLPRADHVTVSVYDVAGRVVATLLDAPLEAGRHSLDWDGLKRGGSPAGAGIYLCGLRGGNRRLTHRLVLLR